MRRLFLYVLIGSVVLSAIMGIFALLASRFGETEIKVLLSTLCVAGASILSMACTAALEKSDRRDLARAGLVTTVLGFLLVLVGLWTEVDDEVYWKTAGSLLIAAGFCTHAALLLLARPAAPRRWIQPTTLVATALLGGLWAWVMWDETRAKEVWRVAGMLAILGTAGTILTAVLHHMARSEGREAAQRPVGSSAVRCPHCGKPLPEELLS